MVRVSIAAQVQQPVAAVALESSLARVLLSAPLVRRVRTKVTQPSTSVEIVVLADLVALEPPLAPRVKGATMQPLPGRFLAQPVLWVKSLPRQDSLCARTAAKIHMPQARATSSAVRVPPAMFRSRRWERAVNAAQESTPAQDSA